MIIKDLFTSKARFFGFGRHEVKQTEMTEYKSVTSPEK